MGFICIRVSRIVYYSSCDILGCLFGLIVLIRRIKLTFKIWLSSFVNIVNIWIGSNQIGGHRLIHSTSSMILKIVLNNFVCRILLEINLVDELGYTLLSGWRRNISRFWRLVILGNQGWWVLNLIDILADFYILCDKLPLYFIVIKWVNLVVHSSHSGLVLTIFTVALIESLRAISALIVRLLLIFFLNLIRWNGFILFFVLNLTKFKLRRFSKTGVKGTLLLAYLAS